ncbi:MAG: DnaD domain protein, partial [Clostridia bacterium]|nr:DnaD domain protein [Clostridia bacterium]
GCVSVDAINEHLASMMQRDMQIKKIIELTGFSRNVNNNDRDMYKVWSQQWNFDDAMIEYGASVCQGKQLFALNNLLAKWKNSGIYTIDEAKAQSSFAPTNSAASATSYTKEQLSEFFYSLDDLDGIE